MQQKYLILEREQSTRLLAWGIRFFLTAALSASQIPGGYAPFALGCVAAAGAGAEGMAALLGAGVGAVLFLEFADGLAFLATAILIFTTATAFHGMRLADKPWFLPLAGAGLFFAVQLIYLLQALSPLERVGPCLAATVLVGASARAYRPLLRPGEEQLEPDGLLFLGMSLLLALCDWTLAGVSIGRILLCCVLVYTAYQRGMVTGVTAGLCAGLGADLVAGNGALLFTAVYGLAGLSAGSRSGQNRLWAAGAFLAAAGVALLTVSGEAGLALVWELPGAALLFLLLPGKAFGGKRVKKTEAAETGKTMEKLKTRLDRTAAVFRDLYDSMGRGGANSTEENPAIVFDRAAEKTCRDCALCELCWQREYTETFNALNDATPFLLERGRAMAKDFPPHFSNRCIHLPEFLTAINGELSAYLLRRQYRRQLEETRRSARGQYAQMSDLLTATAAGLGETVTALGGPAGYRLGAALRPKEGGKVCGDTVSSFETEGGLLCLLLSDGMGSGEAAQRESALTCRLLRQFLQAGIEPEAALKTLNSAMALRGAETGSFTTIDLLSWQRGGMAALYKFGAAPSYIKRGGQVRRITGASLPAGLRSTPAAPDMTRLCLEPGSFVLLISDGVADANHDEWLLDLLAGWDGDDPQTLAGVVLTESVRRGGLQDDCGIQVLQLTGDGAQEV
ncbi:MAG: SpoIIE family protein phosphatase [Oscillibacter sp.]